MFKTNVKEFVSLRRVTRADSLDRLLRLTEFFPKPGMKFHLDPSFEPELQRKAGRGASPGP